MGIPVVIVGRPPGWQDTSGPTDMNVYVALGIALGVGIPFLCLATCMLWWRCKPNR